MGGSAVRLCEPLSIEHRRGLHWFTSLLHKIMLNMERSELKEKYERALNAYSVYSETGDAQLLSLCERILQEALTLQHKTSL